MNKINMATLVELHYGWCRQVFTRKKNLWNKKMNLWVQQYYRSAMLNWWSSLLKFFSHTKLHFRIKMNLAKEDKHLNLAKHFMSFVVVSWWLLWTLCRSSSRQAGNMRHREETKGTEEGERMDVVHAYLRFFNRQHVSSTDYSFLFWVREKPNNVSSEEGVAHNTGVIFRVVKSTLWASPQVIISRKSY